MSESIEREEPTSKAPEPPHDWFLEILVKLAHEGISFGVTLQVGGLLVSGTLASGGDYFDGVAAETSASLSPDAAGSLKELFANCRDVATHQPSERTPPTYRFVHLRDAKFYNTNGSPIPANRGVWWRGRLCEVGGFVVGTLAESRA